MSCLESKPPISENPEKILPVRKHPVHLPPLERHNKPVLLFVTLTIQPRGHFLCHSRFHEAFLLACADADTWSVGRYVIMPDHVHLFCMPCRWPMVGMKRWSGYLKERITKRMNAFSAGILSEGLEGEAVPSRGLCQPFGRLTTGSPSRVSGIILPWRWQPDVWDVQMRSGDHYHEKWEYVRQNPVRAGLAIEPDTWPWQGEINILQW